MLKEEDCTVHYDDIYNVIDVVCELSAQPFANNFCLRDRLEAGYGAIDAGRLELAKSFGFEKILKV